MDRNFRYIIIISLIVHLSLIFILPFLGIFWGVTEKIPPAPTSFRLLNISDHTIGAKSNPHKPVELEPKKNDIVTENKKIEEKENKLIQDQKKDEIKKPDHVKKVDNEQKNIENKAKDSTKASLNSKRNDVINNDKVKDDIKKINDKSKITEKKDFEKKVPKKIQNNDAKFTNKRNTHVDAMDSLLDKLEKDKKQDKKQKSEKFEDNLEDKLEKIENDKKNNSNVENDIDSVSHDSILSVSEKSIIKSRIEQHWKSPIMSDINLKSVNVVLHVKLAEDGSVSFVEVKEVICRINNKNMCNILGESAVRAVKDASPFADLPEKRYNIWKEFDLLFDPSEMIAN